MRKCRPCPRPKPPTNQVVSIMRTGGQILLAQLRLNGAERIFTVPGESFLPVLDALHDDAGIDVIVCRHEGAACMMAEATARLAGPDRPSAGVAIVSRGPGLANAMSGLHVAMQGGTPLLLLVGLPPTSQEGRIGFQEVPLSGLAGAFAKHVEHVRDIARLPETVQRALVIAHGGRPGPVVIGLPEDILAAASDIPDSRPWSHSEPAPTHQDMLEFADAIHAAEWPVLLVGGRWTPEASRQLQAFAERMDVPVLSAFRCQDAIDNRSPVYCGHAGLAPPPKLKAALASADLLITIGTHIDEVTAGGYTSIAVPSPRQRLIHVHPDAMSIGRNHHVARGIVSTIDRFAERLDDLSPSVRAGMRMRWSRLRSDMRAVYESSRSFTPSPGTLRLEDVIAHLDATVPDDAIITNGAGNYAAFLHRVFTYKSPLTQLAPQSGSMGYGLPAAIAAKLARPERDVIALAGDGCFQMVSQDLATAVQYGAAIVLIVANNAGFGTIRAAQTQHYPGRVTATSLVNPDFAALAKAHGANGIRVGDLGAFVDAFERARSAAGPFLIELTIDPAALAPGRSVEPAGKPANKPN